MEHGDMKPREKNKKSHTFKLISFFVANQNFDARFNKTNQRNFN
jgi:hypothetical protein